MSERVTTARVRELRDAATPGPWEHEHIGYGGQEVTMDARHSVFVDGRGNAALIAAAPALAADLIEAREELRLTTPAVDAVRGVIAALCLAPDATYTEVVAAVEERAGMLAHAVQSWQARASGMEAAEREIARLRAIVDAVRSAREDVRSTAARYDAAWTGVESVPNAAQAEEIAARLTESYMAGDALSAALDALLSPADDVARDAPGVG